jgi:hypothetical protein
LIIFSEKKVKISTEREFYQKFSPTATPFYIFEGQCKNLSFKNAIKSKNAPLKKKI